MCPREVPGEYRPKTFSKPRSSHQQKFSGWAFLPREYWSKLSDMILSAGYRAMKAEYFSSFAVYKYLQSLLLYPAFETSLTQSQSS